MSKSTSSWSKQTQIQVVVAQLTGVWAESLLLGSGDSGHPRLIEPCSQSGLVSAQHLARCPGWGAKSEVAITFQRVGAVIEYNP